MDWWQPLLGFELVTIGAILIILTGFPMLIARIAIVWKAIPQVKISILFLAAVAVSPLTRFWAGGALNVLNDFGKVIIFYLLIILIVRSPKEYSTILFAFLLCTTWLAIHSIMQHHLGYGFGGQPPLLRKINNKGESVYQAVAYGTFDDPNDLCVILVVALPILFSQVKGSQNFLLKISSLVGIPLTIYAIWCTNSRGGIVAIFGMIVAAILTYTKGISRYIIIAIAALTVTVLAPSRFSGGAFAGRDRELLWGEGLNMFKSNPLFGVGFGNFNSNTSEHLVAHNTFVHTLAENGLAGYLPFFLLIYLTIAQLRRLLTFKKMLRPNEYGLLFAMNAALIGYLTGLYFISRQYQHIFYVIIGLVVVIVYIISEKNGLLQQVFGPTRKDFRQGTLMGLGSIVFMWAVIRLVNLVT